MRALGPNATGRLNRIKMNPSGMTSVEQSKGKGKAGRRRGASGTLCGKCRNNACGVASSSGCLLCLGRGRKRGTLALDKAGCFRCLMGASGTG
jgi:hypothetical protein